MVRVAIATCVVLMGSLSGSTAWALDPIPGEERFQGMFERPEESSVSSGFDFGMIGEDWFISITPRIELNFGRFGLGLQVPLNLKIVDNDPQNEEIGGVLRKEDWDEPGEFLRVIRYIRFGYKRDFIYFRGGELAAEIGHGTIVSRYLNNTDIDTYRLGLQFDLNTAYGGFETLIADVGIFADDYSGSKMFGARGYVKPVAFWDASSFLNIFAVGYTLVVDANAPYQLASELTPGSTSNYRLRVDDQSNFIVQQQTEAMVMGWDVEAEVFNNMFIDLIPYIDVNYIVGGDAGLHMGAKAAFKLPFLIELTIPVRMEYRYFGPRYIPTYFNTHYELERFNYPAGSIAGRDADATGGAVDGLGRPKANVVRNQNQGGGRNGFFADAALDIAGYLQLGALYEDYDGSPGGNLAVYVSVPALDTFQLKAYYARTSINSVDDIFGLDERSIAVAQARYELFSFLYLVARWTRRWEIDPSTHAIKASDQWKVGAEVGYTF